MVTILIKELKEKRSKVDRESLKTFNQE